jgi:hypothetical protein
MMCAFGCANFAGWRSIAGEGGVQWLEPMGSARLLHDRLEEFGWQVAIADV